MAPGKSGPREERPMLDDLVGVRAARRARRAAALSIAVLLIGGVVLFLFESQTFAQVAIALGVGWGLMWVGLRHITRTGDHFFEEIHRRRWALIATSALLVGAGWAVFLTVWDELGLLLVVLGALPLVLLTLGLRHEPMLSPMDGPPFGETEQG